jgi:hypothetical protein
MQQGRGKSAEQRFFSSSSSSSPLPVLKVRERNVLAANFPSKRVQPSGTRGIAFRSKDESSPLSTGWLELSLTPTHSTLEILPRSSRKLHRLELARSSVLRRFSRMFCRRARRPKAQKVPRISFDGEIENLFILC